MLGADEPAAAGDALHERLVDAFCRDAGPAAALVNATPEPVPLSAMHTIPHLPAWHRGRLVVVGDAAHASSPTSGQGASLAIEDGIVLAQCLRDLPAAEAVDPQAHRRREGPPADLRLPDRLGGFARRGALTAAAERVGLSPAN